MILLLLLAFAGSLAGIFLLLGMTPFAFAEDITRPFARKKKPIARRIEETVNPREPKGIQKTVREARAVMTLTGKGGKFTALCGVSFFLLVAVSYTHLCGAPATVRSTGTPTAATAPSMM